MQIRPRQLTLYRLVLLFVLTYAGFTAQAGPNLDLKSNITWSLANPWFGGFSGAEVSADGRRIFLITDKGSLVKAEMIRNGDSLATLRVISRTSLKYASGSDLKGKRTDAEGLAIGANGRSFISFEHDHRVARLELQSGRTIKHVDADAFARFQPNSGLEALAIHPDGTLYTLPERSGGKRSPFPVFTLRNKQWRVAAHIPRRGPFQPVGADFDDGGLLYLLERAATPLGFRTRIRRFDPTKPRWAEETLLITRPARFDNLEAISVWRDPAGQTVLTLISDDNFLAIQRTQIVEFNVKE